MGNSASVSHRVISLGRFIDGGQIRPSFVHCAPEMVRERDKYCAFEVVRRRNGTRQINSANVTGSAQSPFARPPPSFAGSSSTRGGNLTDFRIHLLTNSANRVWKAARKSLAFSPFVGKLFSLLYEFASSSNCSWSRRIFEPLKGWADVTFTRGLNFIYSLVSDIVPLVCCFLHTLRPSLRA